MNILQKKSDILKAIAQPTRLKIIELLREGERCVCEMIPLLQEEQANISKHLSLLRQSGIVDFRKEGVSVYYRVRHKEIFKIIDIAEKIVKKEMLETVKMLEEVE
jgi:ArsR family transcriptional regulator